MYDLNDYANKINHLDSQANDLYWSREDQSNGLRELSKAEETYLHDYRETKRRFSDYLLTAADHHGALSDVYAMIEVVAVRQLYRELTKLRDIMIRTTAKLEETGR